MPTDLNDLLWSTLTQVLQVLILALLPPLIGLAIATGKKYYDLLKARVGERNWFFVESLVRTNVLAAEQLGLIDLALKSGEAQLNYVISQTQAALDERGIKISLQQLRALIESTYYAEISSQRKPPAIPAGGSG